MRKRENTGHSYAILGRHANFKVFSKGQDQAPKPVQGLRRQVMPSTCHHQKPIKALKQFLGAAFLVLQLFALGASNLSLNAILVESTKQLLSASTQVQAMGIIGYASAQFCAATGLIGDRPYLDVFQSVLVDTPLHVQDHLVQFGRTINQRLAMIGEW